MPTLPDQTIYTGYVPKDLYGQYKTNEAIYKSLGKPAPDHFFFDQGSQYKVNYNAPYSPILVYKGSEVQQIQEAGGVVDLDVNNPAQSTVTFPDETKIKVNVVINPDITEPVIYPGPPRTKTANDYGSMVLAGSIGLLILGIFGRKKK